MARIEIKYDDRELRGVHKGFKRLQQLAKDPRPVLGDFGEALLRSTRQRFDDHKSPQGTPWTPLSTLTRQRKRRPRMLVENPQAGLKATLAWQVIGSDTVSDTVQAAVGTVKNTLLRISLVPSSALKKPRRWPFPPLQG